MFGGLKMMQRQKAPAHILIEIYLKIAQCGILLQKSSVWLKEIWGVWGHL